MAATNKRTVMTRLARDVADGVNAWRERLYQDQLDAGLEDLAVRPTFAAALHGVIVRGLRVVEREMTAPPMTPEELERAKVDAFGSLPAEAKADIAQALAAHIDSEAKRLEVEKAGKR